MRKNDIELSKKVKNPKKFMKESERRINTFRTLNVENPVDNSRDQEDAPLSLDTTKLEDILNNYFYKGKQPPHKEYIQALHKAGYPYHILEKVLKTKPVDNSLDEVFKKYSATTKIAKPKRKTIRERALKIKDNYMCIDVDGGSDTDI